jgi:NADPH:quinone reductase-like Zn-dependent oxidoreductase
MPGVRAAVIEAMEQPPAVRGNVDDPRPGPGQVLIAVDAAALNPVELHIWHGTFRDGEPRLPYVPGVEGVGRVVEGGSRAPGTRVRFEVVGLHPGYGTDGALAELAVAPEDAVTPLPDDVPDGLAAALGATGMTALRALETAAAGPGDTVLVLGATGMVGRCAVQLARAAGAERVIAAGRSAAGLERARELGADATVAIDDGFEDALAGAAPDVIVDALWGAPALAALAAAAVDVRHVNIGRAAGDPLSLPHPLILRKRATLRGLSTAMDSPAERAAAYARVLEHARGGRLTMDVDTFPLEDIAAAWERLPSAGRKLVARVT